MSEEQVVQALLQQAQTDGDRGLEALCALALQRPGPERDECLRRAGHAEEARAVRAAELRVAFEAKRDAPLAATQAPRDVDLAPESPSPESPSEVAPPAGEDPAA